MLGLNRITGKALQGTEHILQSVKDIITTPKGSRVMLRTYGCTVPDMVDRPINQLFEIELHASIAEALARWEPRFLLNSVWIVSRTAQGRVIIGVEGTIVESGATARLEGFML